jgi:preprotein translocase subunit SecG
MLNCSIAGVTLFISIISVIWLIVALMLIGIILIQKGKGGGLGGAFGGAGGGGGLLGTKTGDFLTWVTIGLVFLFFFLAIILVKYGKDTSSDDLKNSGPPTGIVAPEGDGSTTGADTDTPPVTDDMGTEPAPDGDDTGKPTE